MASAPPASVPQDVGHERLQIPTLLRHLADAYEKIAVLEAAQAERHEQMRAVGVAQDVLQRPNAAVQSEILAETSGQQLSPTQMESAFERAREEYHKQEKEVRRVLFSAVLY